MFRKIIDYILVLWLIATSGFYYFYSSIEYIIIGTILVIILFFIKNLWRSLDKFAVILILTFVLWEALQFFILGGFEFRPILGTTVRFFFAYGVVKIANNNFLKNYVSIIFFFSLVSLIFYLLFFVSGVTEGLIDLSKQIEPLFKIEDKNYRLDPKPNIIFFNFHGHELIPKRNSGPFWEPGAFAIFLNLALYFHLLSGRRLLNLKSIVLIVTIITTFSTSGIITLFILLIGYLYQAKIALFFRLILVIASIIFFINIYSEVDFLGQKVEQNIDSATESTGSRFGSALADWVLFKENPILGYGRNIEAKYGVSYFDISEMHRNNGLTNLFVQWGIILGTIYLILYYKALRNVSVYFKSKTRYTALTGFLIILVSGFSQGIFQYPFFHSLIFLGLFIYKFPILKIPPNETKQAHTGQLIPTSHLDYRNPKY